jgi:mono/diheme cytochrome c family protein
MKNFLAGVLCAIVLVAIALAIYLGAGFMEVASEGQPPAWETSLMTAATHASVRRRAGTVPNPLPATDATLIAGGKRYLGDCAGCHGAPGKPPSDFGATFYPPVPQFPRIGSSYTEAQLFWVAKHGIRFSGMSPEGPYYKDPALWSIAAFVARIRNLPPAVTTALQRPAPK